jgi:hypothetical protein
MASKRPEWEVRAHGDPLDDIDADLMTQIVIMLGRKLMSEADQDPTSNSPSSGGHHGRHYPEQAGSGFRDRHEAT